MKKVAVLLIAAVVSALLLSGCMSQGGSMDKRPEAPVTGQEQYDIEREFWEFFTGSVRISDPEGTLYTYENGNKFEFTDITSGEVDLRSACSQTREDIGLYKQEVQLSSRSPHTSIEMKSKIDKMEKYWESKGLEVLLADSGENYRRIQTKASNGLLMRYQVSTNGGQLFTIDSKCVLPKDPAPHVLDGLPLSFPDQKK